MPVGASNALKPRGARNLDRPARILGHATAPTTQPTRVKSGARAGGVSSQKLSNPLEQVSVKVKIRFGEDEKQRRPPRGQDERSEREAIEIRNATTRETRGKESAKGIADAQHKLDLHQEKSFILKTPEGKYEARGRRKRVPVVKSQGEQTGLRQTVDAVKLQERRVPRVEHIPERTKESPKQVKTQGRRKRVTAVRPVTAANYFRVEKAISDLYDVKCALKRDEISRKADFINTIVEKQIIMKIHELDDRFNFDILRAGSYYEKLKVGKPNEFDIMVCLKGNNVSKCFEVQVCPIRRATPHLGGFAYLQYQSHKDTSKCWENLLINSPSGVGRVLSSHLIVGLFRKLISRRCQKIFQHHKGAVRFEEPIIKGPAVNVTFMSNSDVINVDIVLSIEVPTWPANARRWGAEYYRWPSRKMIDDIQSKGCHVVPKATNMDPRYWRLSFSLAEKSLLRAQAIDEDKKCYRIIKHIYEVNKTHLEPLCSYFLKTLFLHLRTSGFFKRGQREKFPIIDSFYKELISKIEKKKLQHFFVPDVNLFWNLTDSEARNMVLFLKRILSNLSSIQSAIIFFEYLSRTSVA